MPQQTAIPCPKMSDLGFEAIELLEIVSRAPFVFGCAHGIDRRKRIANVGDIDSDVGHLLPAVRVVAAVFAAGRRLDAFRGDNTRAAITRRLCQPVRPAFKTSLWQTRARSRPASALRSSYMKRDCGCPR